MAVPLLAPHITDMTAKVQLRQALRARRSHYVATLDSTTRIAHAVAIARELTRYFADASSVAGYVAVGSELDALPSLTLACAQGLQTSLPHLSGRIPPMRFLRWQPGTPLVAGPYNVQQPHVTAQPVAPDLILVPLLGFDRAGNRIGQGGGFYDRALSDYPQARAIGLAWRCQYVDQLPVDPWDRPLDAIITEQEVIIP
jgi:5-formyltetrahydrofolate cyclo-ligase